MNYDLLADLLLPQIDKTPAYYIEKYPNRNVPKDAVITRYAPSPTGFQHIGSVFASLVEERAAHLSGGIFYLRIEDTDQKREVAGAIGDTITTLKDFDIFFDEGMLDDFNEKGNYGPYKQSMRKDIYQSFVKDLIRKGLAYPCFCSEDDLNAIREEQQELKLNPGYYGQWAAYRNADFDTIQTLINAGKPYVIRLKSPGNSDSKIIINDVIKGKISMPENNQDIVILKSDGLPTYHFAHAVDDTLMRTTHVIRGEEWLPSAPIHVQLFEILGSQVPKYVHIPTIMKMDGTSKRKLSKRKDPEMAITYYKQEGYPFVAVIEYLLNIVNSNFEDWRNENPKISYKEFDMKLEKMSKSGALFDIIKLYDTSKNVISRMDYNTVYNYYIQWAEKYDKDMYDIVTKHADYSKTIFNIDRETAKPRKDYGKWTDVKEKIQYFYDEIFDCSLFTDYNLPSHINEDEAKEIIANYKEIFNINDNQDTWFQKLKDMAISMGYAKNKGEYKKNPDKFKGVVADVALIIRIALTNRQDTPDLYTIINLLGKTRVNNRFSNFLD